MLILGTTPGATSLAFDEQNVDIERATKLGFRHGGDDPVSDARKTDNRHECAKKIGDASLSWPGVDHADLCHQHRGAWEVSVKQPSTTAAQDLLYRGGDNTFVVEGEVHGRRVQRLDFDGVGSRLHLSVYAAG